MTVSNAHLATTCRVWDGTSFSMMERKEALKMQKQGLLQVSENLQAKDLKAAGAFKKPTPPKSKPKPKSQLPPGVDIKDKTYATREMKAETK